MSISRAKRHNRAVIDGNLTRQGEGGAAKLDYLTLPLELKKGYSSFACGRSRLKSY